MVGQIFFVRSVFLLEYKNGHLKSHLARCSVDTYITTCMLSETLSFYIFKCFNYALYVLEFLSEYKRCYLLCSLWISILYSMYGHGLYH